MSPDERSWDDAKCTSVSQKFLAAGQKNRVKREMLDRHPWIGRNLYNAFLESKRRSLERLLDPAVSRYPLPWLPSYARNMRDMFDGDPFPYGIEENRPTLETFLRYTYEQGIAHHHAKPEEIFQAGIMAPVKV